jgi:hypothetical protein
MKVALVLPTVLGVLLCSAKQTNEAETLLKEALQATQDFTAVLKTVKDKTSAEAAVPKLDATAKKWLGGVEALDKLASSKDQQLEKLWKEKYEKLLNANFGLLTMELERLEKMPELMKICEKSETFKNTFGLEVLGEQKVTRAKLDVQTLEKAVLTYQVNNGQYPQNLKALAEKQPGGGAALIKEPLLVDPWGQPYLFEPNTRHPKTDVPLIYSKGPPGKNMVIRNWN